MSKHDIPVKCTRCRNKHHQSERIDVPLTNGMTVSTCPRCACREYFDLSPQVAWCRINGLIEIGDVMPPDNSDGSGVIKIAEGPKSFLQGRLSAVARHGQGNSRGKLLVPGIPEADSQREAAKALGDWLAWCGKRNSKDGVVFATALDRGDV